jgi:hypothetical protein
VGLSVVAATVAMAPTPADAHVLAHGSAGGGPVAALLRLVVLIHVASAGTTLTLAAWRARATHASATTERRLRVALASTVLTGAVALGPHLGGLSGAGRGVLAVKLALVAAIGASVVTRHRAVVLPPLGLSVVAALGVVLAVSTTGESPTAPTVAVAQCAGALGRLAAHAGVGVGAEAAASTDLCAAPLAIDATGRFAGEQVARRTLPGQPVEVVAGGSARARAFVAAAEAAAPGVTFVPSSSPGTVNGATVSLVALDGDGPVPPSAAPGGLAVWAPWLLGTAPAADDGDAVVVALPADPAGREALRYRRGLAALDAHVRPTGEGFLGFVEATGAPIRPVLAATAPVGVLPAVLAGAHGGSGGPWIPGRALVTVAR